MVYPRQDSKYIFNAQTQEILQIIYNSWEGYYVVHTPRGKVEFHNPKDKQVLPYILDESAQEAAMMLMQMGARQHVASMQNCTKTEHTMLVETVQGNYKGYTKNNILKAKKVRRVQEIMGNPSNKDYKGVVSNHLISNCPVTHASITNAQTIFSPDLSSIRGKTV